MAKTLEPEILGLGGVFFRCPDVEAYRDWWAEHMGVDVAQWGAMEWDADGKGRTMMSPFQEDSEYLAPSTAQFMINLRVNDVRGLMEKVRASGMEIVGEIEYTEYGIFGWFIDPAGLKIELWQEV